MSASTISGEARRYNILNGRIIIFLTMAMGIFASSQVLGGNNELYDGDAVGRRRRYTSSPSCGIQQCMPCIPVFVYFFPSDNNNSVQYRSPQQYRSSQPYRSPYRPNRIRRTYRSLQPYRSSLQHQSINE